MERSLSTGKVLWEYEKKCCEVRGYARSFLQREEGVMATK